MIDFFQRKQIFIKVTACILALFIADNLILVIFGKTVDGKVTKMVISPGGYRSPSFSYPLIEFVANNQQYSFKGNWETYYKTGEKLKVIYRPWWPKKAKVYTFWGILKSPLTQFMVIFIIWSLLYSSFKKKNVSKSKPDFKQRNF